MKVSRERAEDRPGAREVRAALNGAQSGFRSPLDFVLGAYEADETVLARLLPDPDGPAEPGAPPVPPDGVNYIICYVPRSGSTHLSSLLQSTGLAGAPAEYFNLGYADMPQERRHTFARTGVHTIESAAAEYGSRSVEGYLRTVAAKSRSANGVFGLKADITHVSVLTRRRLFWNAQWDWKYVFVTRRDLVAQAVSYATASETGLWTSESGERSDVQLSERTIAEALLKIADITCRWECAFDLYGIEPLRVAYEEIEQSPDAAVERCLAYLGIGAERPARAVSSVYRKQRTARSEEWVRRIRAQARNG
ncbi:MAG: hypothetical protein JWM87_327 [Candidatus Eremiobacteraeota bacterium]|nr:hypothetical protein [Candidatus Eremiobacteraeota bacterium]